MKKSKGTVGKLLLDSLSSSERKQSGLKQAAVTILRETHKVHISAHTRTKIASLIYKHEDKSKRSKNTTEETELKVWNSREHLSHFSRQEVSQCPLSAPIDPLTSKTCHHLTSGWVCAWLCGCAAVSIAMKRKRDGVCVWVDWLWVRTLTVYAWV